MRGVASHYGRKVRIPSQEAVELRLRFLAMLGMLNTTVVKAASEMQCSLTVIHTLCNMEQCTPVTREKVEAWLAKHEGVAA